MNKKGFTLIELLAVIVVLAIIALIATPIVMNVIKNAQEGADARSVETFGKEIESLYYQQLVSNPDAEINVDALKASVETSGSEVTCTNASLNDNDEFVLTGCTVGGRTDRTYTYNSTTGAK